VPSEALPRERQRLAPRGDWKLSRRERAAELELRGDLDLADVVGLDRALTAALTDGPTDTLLVDMTEVTFIDSSVLHWIIRSDRRTREGRARLTVVVAPGRVRDVFAITGLEQRLAIVDAT
jgi:anti-sigma B factor antagonist